MAVDSIDRVNDDAFRASPVLKDEVMAYYRTLLARLPWPHRGDELSAVRSLGISSCYEREGVSTVASHLAVTAAGYGKRRVLLIDANAARPAVHQTFGVDSRPGLAEILADPEGLPGAIQPTGVTGLWVLPSGRADRRRGEVPDAIAFGGLMAGLRSEFDLVIVDLPAADKAEVLTPLATAVDGLLLVIEAERVRSEVARRTVELLRRADVRVLGAVLNKRRQHVPRWLYRML